MDNPIIWSFGKVEIKFNKPLDPLNQNDSFKNIQKPKIEFTFPAEEENKSSMVSFFIIIILVNIHILRISITYVRLFRPISANGWIEFQ